MAADVSTERPITEVVRGIVEDFQKLMTQQVALLRAEVKSDWEKTKMALMPMAAGAAFCLVALVQFGIAAGMLIYWATAPAGIDPARIPMWGAFGIAGILFAAIGGIMIAVGARAFNSFNPLPDETMRAFEKNLQSFVTTTGSPSDARSMPH